MARAHSLHGAIVGLALAPLAWHLDPGMGPVLGSAAWTLGTTVGSLVPDLDHPKSKLTHALGPVTWLINKILVRLSKSVYYLTRSNQDYPDTNGHRCLTHTPVFAAVLAAAVSWGLAATDARPAAVLVGAALGTGCLAHLFGDSLTNSGVPWLWPLRSRSTGRRWQHYGIPKVMRFETGGGTSHGKALTWKAHGEHIVTGLSALLVVVVPLAYLWEGWGV